MFYYYAHFRDEEMEIYSAEIHFLNHHEVVVCRQSFHGKQGSQCCFNPEVRKSGRSLASVETRISVSRKNRLAI